MAFDIFSTVGDYPKMLNKIALCTLIVSIAAIWFLRTQFPAFDSHLKPLNLPISVGAGINVPLATFALALMFAFIARVIKLHDRLSDVFGIRQRFDVSEILFPLALGAGASITTDQIRSLKKQRESLMYKSFYAYASSTPGKAVIDSHYITMALDQWCWYWVVLETTFIVFVLAITFLVAKHFETAAILLLLILTFIGVLQVIRKLCSDYALQEVEAILTDVQRKLAISGVFSAL